MRTYEIRKAVLDDLESLYALRTEAEDWLAEAGVEQWTPRWHTHARRLIRQNVEDGESWVVTPEGSTEVVATVRIAGPDYDFWEDSDHLEIGAHMYKLIVRRDHAGIGLGDAIIDWVCQKAADDGRLWVRIDIWRTNSGLRRYYQNRGFRYVRTVEVPYRNSGLLLQRPVNFRSGPPDIRLAERARE